MPAVLKSSKQDFVFARTAFFSKSFFIIVMLFVLGSSKQDFVFERTAYYMGERSQFMQFTGLATWFNCPKQLTNALNVHLITESRTKSQKYGRIHKYPSRRANQSLDGRHLTTANHWSPKFVVLSSQILFIGTKHSFGPPKILVLSPQIPNPWSPPNCCSVP